MAHSIEGFGFKHRTCLEPKHVKRAAIVAPVVLCAYAPPLRISDPRKADTGPVGHGFLYDSRVQVNLGYEWGIENWYTLGREIGRGGYGIVRSARCNETGASYACKSLRKVIRDPNISEKRRLDNPAAIVREVDILRALSGSLSVAYLRDVFEDEHAVHMVFQLCRGHDLRRHLTGHPLSESSVVRYMRGVLQTVAQCHASNILHRDVKPGNFMFLDCAADSPLKGIDFGLARRYHTGELPLTDLGLEGTPWYMSPEALTCEAGPHCDVWSAGVCCHQLLAGRFPFDDRQSPHNPAISRVWNSILYDVLDVSGRGWQLRTEAARDFVSTLLRRTRLAGPAPWRLCPTPGCRANPRTGRATPPPCPCCPLLYSAFSAFCFVSPVKRAALQAMAAELEASQRVPRDESSHLETLLGLQDPNLVPLLYRLGFTKGDGEAIKIPDIASTLLRLGFAMREEEAVHLLTDLDVEACGALTRCQLAVALLDFDEIRLRDTEAWLCAARSVFKGLDRDRMGVIDSQDVAACLLPSSPRHEVQSVLRWALAEAGQGNSSPTDTITLGSFLRLLQYPGHATLSMFDSRYRPSAPDSGLETGS
eukprot:jgi/Botrbrau1/16445/Bobra.0142s0041.1